MTTFQKVGKWILGVGSVLGILAFVGLHFSGQSIGFGATSFTSGQVQYTPFIFVNGFAGGTSQQFIVDASGNVTTTGTLTAAGITNSSNTVTVNGITMTYYRSTFTNTATTTPCNFVLPSATTSLMTASVLISSSTVGAFTTTIATSSLPNATTSLIASKAGASGQQQTLDWDPGVNNSINGPGINLNVGIQGGFGETGVCTAAVRTVN